jgi:hypothetical protein
MAQAVPGNPARDDPAALGQEIPQEADVLEIDRPFLDAKTTGPAALEKPSAAAPFTAPSATASATFTFHGNSPSIV